MALFVVPRYVSDEEDNLENNSQLLLLRLQEQAKIRQLKKEEQNRYLSTRVTGPEPEILGADTLKDLKQKVKKKKVNQESPLTEGHGKESKKRYADLPENGDGSRRSKKHKGKSRIPEGKTEAAKRGENMLDTCLENSFIPAEEKVDGFTVSVKENEAGGEQKTLMQSSKMSPTSSMIVFSSCDQKIVQKVQPLLPQWFTQTKVFQRQIKENLIPLQDVPVIHPKLMKKLQANGIESLFPVQAEVIPAILESGANGMSAGKGGFLPSDICVSAPTGSGKTLAFVIPVVQVLMDRVICHVRALAVLPTKELAQQVTKVFNIYTDGTGLKVVQLTGQKSFAKEQESLVETTLMGFRSLADIVVATPGRLVDHLQQSPQFSLRELRFLIIDEADRMIDNMHQNWLQQLVEAVYRDKEGFGSNNRLFRRTELNPSVAARSCYPQLPLQKLLFSATLTQNPEKLQQLGLHQPRLFRPANPGRAEAQPCAKEKYILPEGLLQYYVPCHLSWKPLFLLHFLLREECPQVLCFTNSKEASHRLFLLIRAFGGVNVAEFSSRLSPSKRKLTLKEFEQGKIQLLISTDATARGIDFGGVKCVVSYDAPPFIRTYIHRVGRTARAGKAGQAFTMLLKQQQHRFLKMLKEAGLPELQQQVVKNVSLQPLLQQYEQALAELAHLVKEERAGKRC